MNAMIQIRAKILADSNARIETAKATLAEAEAHKAIVLDLLAKGREELVEDLATIPASLGESVPAFKPVVQAHLSMTRESLIDIIEKAHGITGIQTLTLYGKKVGIDVYDNRVPNHTKQ